MQIAELANDITGVRLSFVTHNQFYHLIEMEGSTMKRLHLLLAVLVALAMANPIWAQGMSQKKMGMKGMMMDSDCPMMGGSEHMQSFYLKKAKTLGLSEAQMTQLQKIKISTQKAVIMKEADLKIAKIELDELMQNAKAKRSDLEARAKKVEDLKSQIRLAQFKAKLDARSVLTPAQLEQAQSMKTPCTQGMAEMMNNTEKREGCPMMGKMDEKGGASQHEKHHPKAAS